MSPAHGLMDHGGNDNLPINHGPAAMLGGTLAGVSACGRRRARKLTERGGKVRGEDGEPH
jgi:hypothetical protein